MEAMRAVPSEVIASPTDNQPAAEPKQGTGGGIRLLAIRVMNYLTNHIIAHVPSYKLRHLWYRKVLGIQLEPGAGVHLGCYVWFYGPNDVRRSQVRIGRNSHINRDCVLDVRGGLTIGENVSVSADVSIVTIAKLATSRGPAERKAVSIEDNVWIGTRAIIMPGVTLGRGAVVGAGAVVINDVPPLAIVFGSPARTVGKRPAEEADYVLEGRFPLFE
jgi:acetyltransferase-like isoleucine patch superfamily enzyme